MSLQEYPWQRILTSLNKKLGHTVLFKQILVCSISANPRNIFVGLFMLNTFLLTLWYHHPNSPSKMRGWPFICTLAFWEISLNATVCHRSMPHKINLHYNIKEMLRPWWHHDLETLFCVTGPLWVESRICPHKKASNRGFNVFFFVACTSSSITTLLVFAHCNVLCYHIVGKLCFLVMPFDLCETH